MKKHMMSLIMATFFMIGLTSGEAFASSVYKVQNGDTLWDIAQKNNVAVEDLLNWNGLQSAMIFPEQEIKTNAKNKVYTVQKGDTLSEIAENHQISLSDLMKLNAVSSHLIYPGTS